MKDQNGISLNAGIKGLKAVPACRKKDTDLGKKGNKSLE
jgi:hypothetical protein